MCNRLALTEAWHKAWLPTKKTAQDKDRERKQEIEREGEQESMRQREVDKRQNCTKVHTMRR